jgi:hypothetical protein
MTDEPTDAKILAAIRPSLAAKGELVICASSPPSEPPPPIPAKPMDEEQPAEIGRLCHSDRLHRLGDRLALRCRDRDQRQPEHSGSEAESGPLREQRPYGNFTSGRRPRRRRAGGLEEWPDSEKPNQK